MVRRETHPWLGRVTDTVELAEWRAHQDAMATRLVEIADVERQIAALQADQLELTASFLTDRLTFDQSHGFASDQAQYRGMVAEVAIARGVSVVTAGSFLNDAWPLTTRHPHTMAALRAGRIGRPQPGPSPTRPASWTTQPWSPWPTRSSPPTPRTSCPARSAPWPRPASPRSTPTPHYVAASANTPTSTCSCNPPGPAWPG